MFDLFGGGRGSMFHQWIGDEGSHVSLGMGLFAHQYVGTAVSTAQVLSVLRTTRPNSKTCLHFNFTGVRNERKLCCDGIRTLDIIVT